MEFLSWQDDSWKPNNNFIWGNIDWELNDDDYYFDHDEYFNTSLSGDTAIIRIPSLGEDGEILVYKQNLVGFWEVIDPPHSNKTSPCSFGQPVDIDGSLLVVGNGQEGGIWDEVQVMGGD